VYLTVQKNGKTSEVIARKARKKQEKGLKRASC
jgi:hypothetical protein